jgi:hypothetical protein
MANPLKRKILTITGSLTQITGSIYQVCADGTAGDIVSASFGWQTASINPTSPVPLLNAALGDANEPNCFEADFTFISASAGLNVYYKTNGDSGPIENA